MKHKWIMETHAVKKIWLMGDWISPSGNQCNEYDMKITDVNISFLYEVHYFIKE